MRSILHTGAFSQLRQDWDADTRASHTYYIEGVTLVRKVTFPCIYSFQVSRALYNQTLVCAKTAQGKTCLNLNIQFIC